MVFAVTVVQKPTVLEAQEGAVEKVLIVREVVSAANRDAALLTAGAQFASKLKDAKTPLLAVTTEQVTQS